MITIKSRAGEYWLRRVWKPILITRPEALGTATSVSVERPEANPTVDIGVVEMDMKMAIPCDTYGRYCNLPRTWIPKHPSTIFPLFPMFIPNMLPPSFVHLNLHEGAFHNRLKGSDIGHRLEV